MAEGKPVSSEPTSADILRIPLRAGLGSTSVTTCGNTGGCGAVGYQGVVARQWYHPYGSVRAGTGALPTDITFTGQRSDATGLYFYNARYYSPLIGRFISADTIVPEPGNPQALNRYAYVFNNPLKYVDPTGHLPTPCANPDGVGYSKGCNSGSQPVQRSIPKTSRTGNHGSQVKAFLGEPEAPGTKSAKTQLLVSQQNRSDYDSINLGFPIVGPVGGSMTVTRDKYGDCYLGIGLSLSPIPYNADFYSGVLVKKQGSGKGEVQQRLTEWATSAGIGFVVGRAYVWSGVGFGKFNAMEGGLYTPQLSLTVSYTWLIIGKDERASFHPVAVPTTQPYEELEDSILHPNRDD